VQYKEGVLVGYRWFDAKNLTPAFPFGFGLSYTTFALRKLKVTARSASIEVVNTGRRTGVAVPQLYLGLPQLSDGGVEPPKQLKGFRSLRLGPGRRRRITFPITRRDLSYWDVKANAWKVQPGCVAVMVGSSSRDIAQRTTLPVAISGARC
jgi:beta-glucosidase